MFFQQRDPVHQTMYRLVRRLAKAQLPYAIVGGMALNAHSYRRTTKDVDILLTVEGFAEFGQMLLGDPQLTRKRIGAVIPKCLKIWEDNGL